jgi:hypothetical protein
MPKLSISVKAVLFRRPLLPNDEESTEIKNTMILASFITPKSAPKKSPAMGYRDLTGVTAFNNKLGGYKRLPREHFENFDETRRRRRKNRRRMR